MKIAGFIVVLLISSFGFAQSKFIDQLEKQQWNVTQSKQIINDPLAKSIIAEGEENLIYLFRLFCNTTNTKVFSSCLNRNLTVGETAIILADHIEGMPYYKVFRIQNCTMDFCKNNPNRVEYYLKYRPIHSSEIRENYSSHLLDSYRWKDKKGSERKQTKKFIRKWKQQLAVSNK